MPGQYPTLMINAFKLPGIIITRQPLGATDPITEPTVNGRTAQVVDGVLDIQRGDEPVKVVVPPNTAMEIVTNEVTDVKVYENAALVGVHACSYEITGADTISIPKILGGGRARERTLLKVQGNGRTELSVGLHGGMKVDLKGNFAVVDCRAESAEIVVGSDTKIDTLRGQLVNCRADFQRVDHNELTRLGTSGEVQVNGQPLPPTFPTEFTIKPASDPGPTLG